MNESRNIYSKEDLPPPRRPRKARKSKSSDVVGHREAGSVRSRSSGSPHELFYNRERRPTLEEQSQLPEPSPRVVRRRRVEKVRRSSGQLVALSLVLVLVAYLGFLGYVFVRGQKQAPVSVAPSEQPRLRMGEEQDAGGETLDLADLSAYIARWTECTRTLESALLFNDEAHASETIKELEGLLEESPRRVDLLYTMALVAHKKRDYAYARALLLQVLEADPRYTGAQEELARLFIETQQYEHALLTGKWLLKRDPYSAVGLDTVALAEIQMGRPDEALSPLRKLIGLDRDNIIALNRLATAYADLGQPDKAVELFRSVLKKDSSNSMTYYNLATCYAQQQKDEEVVNILAQASALFGHSFVAAWTQNPEFDPVRTNTSFTSFMTTLRSTTGTALLPRPGQKSVPMPGSGLTVDKLPVSVDELPVLQQ